MQTDEFSSFFRELTGNWPLSWQIRLYEKHFSQGNLPSVVDIPTGLGKTMVMAIWLIARSKHPNKVPTRLIYVVDRRTVVDQATDLAMNLRENFGKEKLAISTLRGQLADNREWSRDPSKPAIIVGTVDLIGSALLFSGYRSSYKRRPLEAGLLGQDSLLVLDEAHLSKPFEKLVCAINNQGRFQKDREGKLQGKPMQVISMSATTASERLDCFKLEESDFGDEIVRERFNAKKQLTIQPAIEKNKLNDALKSAAIELAENSTYKGKRIVVFVRSPESAKEIAEKIRNHAKPSKSKSNPDSRGPYANSVEVLTGTMRGLERDRLVEEDVFVERWFNGNLEPDDPVNQPPVFLVSTSAGEVGFDLNADHMVCDATTIDSFIQRLGRVNRRGLGDATAILIKQKEPPDKTDLDKACIATLDLLKDVGNVSPKNIAALKASSAWMKKTDNGKSTYENACSPVPTTIELTDILLDAWAMTSITEPMPGRPEVGPWIRGIADDLPQTTIAWRTELDEPGFIDLDLTDIVEWFDTHRVLAHEALSVPTSAAAKWFTDRWDNLDYALKSKLAKQSIVVDRCGMQLVTVEEFVNQLSRKNTIAIRYANIILPASFGGIERGVGLLDATAPKQPEDAEVRLAVSDVADLGESMQRQRKIITKTEEGNSEIRILGGGTIPSKKPKQFSLQLESNDERTSRLVSYIPSQEKLEYGLVKQTLQQHVSEVRRAIDHVLVHVSIPDDVKIASQLAASWHDHGKNRERWQWSIGGTATVETTDWMQQHELEDDGKHLCLGKSGDGMKRDSRGYRHEFGSLREFTDAFNDGKLLDNARNPISRDVFDLAMHLIATHHGRGRPHFPKGGFDPNCESRSDEVHTESIRRFARLQRKYGWWYLAWLENLLRCADALASANEETTEIGQLDAVVQ